MSMSVFDDALAGADEIIIETFADTLQLTDVGREVHAAVDRQVSDGVYDEGGYVFYTALITAADAAGLARKQHVRYNGKAYQIKDIDNQGGSVVVEFA